MKLRVPFRSLYFSNTNAFLTTVVNRWQRNHTKLQISINKNQRHSYTQQFYDEWKIKYTSFDQIQNSK